VGECAAASSSFRLPGIESVVGIKRILKGTAIALAVVAVASFVLGALPFRSQVLWELAIGLPLILLARYASIVRLRKLREQGEARVGVLLVSPSRARGQLTREVIDDGRFELVGAVDPDNVDASATPALISSQAISEGADAVMISCSTAMTPKQIRQLAWELESHDIRLLISSRVTGFANNRAHLERVADEVVIEVDNCTRRLDLTWSSVRSTSLFPLGSCCSLPR
jgi:FlaA1/EpsC-like NDP-sugar epimerase